MGLRDEYEVPPPSVEKLRKASKAVYAACEKSVADDISEMLIWAANKIEELERRQ
jgi:hypothetical protein